MLTYPNRATCKRRLEGPPGFSLSPVCGRCALSIMIVQRASPGDVVDDGKLGAPKDGCGMRQCLNKVDVVVKGLWPSAPWAQLRVGPGGNPAYQHRATAATKRGTHQSFLAKYSALRS